MQGSRYSSTLTSVWLQQARAALHNQEPHNKL